LDHLLASQFPPLLNQLPPLQRRQFSPVKVFGYLDQAVALNVVGGIVEQCGLVVVKLEFNGRRLGFGGKGGDTEGSLDLPLRCPKFIGSFANT